jgi:Flp pilus assembly protein TadD
MRTTIALAAIASLAACATSGGEQEASVAVTPPAADARAQIGREDLLTQMTFWAAEYQTQPTDLDTARRFADVLRRGGRAQRAAQVAAESLQRHPNDSELLMTYGLAQIAAGSPQEALRPLALIAQADPQNWRARSALGVALDQVGRFGEARMAYQEALAIRADEPSVLTNLGMSHLLGGDPEAAEPILRQSAALPGAPPEARQNLPIAIALQGRFDEAEQLERIDLPPQAAAANIAYLRTLLNDPRSWGDLRSSME